MLTVSLPIPHIYATLHVERQGLRLETQAAGSREEVEAPEAGRLRRLAEASGCRTRLKRLDPSVGRQDAQRNAQHSDFGVCAGDSSGHAFPYCGPVAVRPAEARWADLRRQEIW